MEVQLWTDLSQLRTKTYNLCLMKISAYHKSRGDNVTIHNALIPCDRLYCSKVFSSELTNDNLYTQNAIEVIRGGTGYNLTENLSCEIEHIYPDYELYRLNEAVGFMTRGCPNACEFCICSKKEGRVSQQVADIYEFWNGQKSITLLDPNVLACKTRENVFKQLNKTNAWVRFEQGLDARFIDGDSIALLKSIKIKEFYFAWDLEKYSTQIKHGLLKVRKCYKERNDRNFKVYVLVNYNTPFDFDVERVEWLKSNGFDPYVMIFRKWDCAKKYNHLQRAVNNKIIFRSLKNLFEYKPLKFWNKRIEDKGEK